MPCGAFGLCHIFALEQLSCSWQMVHHVHYRILYRFVLLFRAVNSFVTNVQQTSVGSQGPYKHETALLLQDCWTLEL